VHPRTHRDKHTHTHTHTHVDACTHAGGSRPSCGLGCFRKIGGPLTRVGGPSLQRPKHHSGKRGSEAGKKGLGGGGDQGQRGEEWGRETLPGSPSNPKLSLDHFSHNETVGVAMPGTVSHADPQTLAAPGRDPDPPPSLQPRPRPPAQLTSCPPCPLESSRSLNNPNSRDSPQGSYWGHFLSVSRGSRVITMPPPPSSATGT